MSERGRRTLGVGGSRVNFAVHLLTCLVALYALWLPFRYASLNSATYDECNHIACGLEWWQNGSYEALTITPPLARVAVAALPNAAGVRLPPNEQWGPREHSPFEVFVVGDRILGTGAEYERHLQLARYGTLLFFGLLLLGTWALARGRRHPVAGLLAVAFVATLPAVTAHASLATTDIAAAAAWVGFMVALRAYLQRPTWLHILGLAAMIAAGLLSKFSFVLYAPFGALAYWVTQAGAWRARQRLAVREHSTRHLITVALAGLLVWAGYRFSWGPVAALPSGTGELSAFGPLREMAAWQRALLNLPLPAPELFHGLLFTVRHQLHSHQSYLLGEASETGLPLFYLVALGVKTPLSALLGGAAALLMTITLYCRRYRRVALAQAWGWVFIGLVLVGSTVSSYNSGVRHLLPVYPVLAVLVAGAGLASWHTWSARWQRVVLGLAMLCAIAPQAWSSHRARDNPLAYFNVLAAQDPGSVLLGSDFDWGQDLFRLREFANSQRIGKLSVAFFGMMNPCVHGLPELEPLKPGQPTAGWIAISETLLRGQMGFGTSPDPCRPELAPQRSIPNAFRWLRDQQPVARLGAIRVYHLPVVEKIASFGANAGPVRSLVQAELGELGAAARVGRDAGVEFITADGDAPEAVRPARAERVVNYRFAVPLVGGYDLYLRYRVGPRRYDDDSLFVAKRWGSHDPTDHRAWALVNGLVTVGYSRPDEVVGGGAGADVDPFLASAVGQPTAWRWLNLSAYGRRTPGFRFSDGKEQLLQIALREDGLQLDQLAMVPSGIEHTVAELDAGTIHVIQPATPSLWVPPGPALATGHSKYLGSIYSSMQQVNFRAYFNHVTPENAGKWGEVEVRRDEMDWAELDAAFALAKSEQPPLPFRLHVLLWGNQQPGWIEELPAAEQREEIEEWFAAVAERYGAGLDYVEVVNEPLHDPPSERGNGGGNYMDALGGKGENGWAWVVNAFRLAREHFPQSKLMINEYSMLEGKELTATYAQLIQALQAEALVDVIGVQGHSFSLKTETDVIVRSIDMLASLGLPIVVSELDIAEPDDARQLAEYQRLFPLLWEHPAVEGIVFWGYRPGMWMGPRGAILAHEDGRERPALKWLREYLRMPP